MKSLKDALLQAGLRSEKVENERRRTHGPKKKSEVHQKTRTFCEVCKRNLPDVERYHHRNALLDVQWICIACADENQINDECRQTHQSQMAQKKMFKRFYGPTKKFFPQNKNKQYSDKKSKPESFKKNRKASKN